MVRYQERTGISMIRAFLGGLSFLLALVLGLAAFSLLVGCILPWLKAPDTTHVTWIFAGAQFTGRQLFMPFTVFVVAAVMIAILGLWILKRRS
jgi:hypothetical protein